MAPGSLLAVYDLGGGTFDVTIVRWIATGWAIVATGGLDDVGGIDLDASIVDHLGRTVGGRDPRRWRRLLAPTDHAGRRQLRAFHDDLRRAKEHLSRAPSTVIRVPGLEIETHLSREEFEAIAAPWLNRTVGRVVDVLRGAGLAPDRLAGSCWSADPAGSPWWRRCCTGDSVSRRRSPIMIHPAAPGGYSLRRR